MIRAMSPLARKNPQKNLTPVEIQPATRQTSLVLILLPEWGTYFPPYNLSRLAAVTRAAGYQTTVYDVNVACWNKLKGVTDVDYWDPSREWMWQGDWYKNEIAPHVQPIYQEYIEKIVALNPDVIGFSLYYCNEVGSYWMAEQLRQRLPNAKIIAGGPQAIAPTPVHTDIYDHFIQGEGEQLLLNLLEKIENNIPATEKYLKNPPGLRLDLDQMPFPDYSDYDLNEYSMPNGISSEVSRGCVANCVFCTEVHFWKYRGRMSGNILDELEHQNRLYGIDLVWFIDSLVNGNLKELRAFAQGVVTRGLKIKWQGYARNDGRMDLDYFKDLAASGCFYLNYGVESGSQRVLDDMKKHTTREAIEQNFKNSAEVGILTSTNWIIGFPTEQPQDVADTFTISWRIQNYKILNFSPGVSMMLSPGAEITDNPGNFGISPLEYMQTWCNVSMTNTKLHRLIRQKTFLIFLQQLQPKEYIWGYDRPELKKLYDIEYDPANADFDMPYEEFDYQIIKPGINPVANSAVNEIWPLLRTLWRALGAFEMTVRFEPEADMREWGFRLACDYTATHYFKIDADGQWQADFKYDFKQTPEQPWVKHTWEDYSFKLDWAGSGQWRR